MTDTPPSDLALLAERVGQLVDRLDLQTTALDGATHAMRRHRRATWLAIAALAVALLVAGLVVRGWVVDRSQEAAETRRAEAAETQAACERGNLVREGVVRAARIAVETSALELAGDDPVEQAEARRIADEVAATVAADPGLRLRDC